MGRAGGDNMHIKNHRLHAGSGEPVAAVRSPNQGGPLTANYLVMHYTAGSSAESSIQARYVTAQNTHEKNW